MSRFVIDHKRTQKSGQELLLLAAVAYLLSKRQIFYTNYSILLKLDDNKATVNSFSLWKAKEGSVKWT